MHKKLNEHRKDRMLHKNVFIYKDTIALSALYASKKVLVPVLSK